MYGKEKNVSEKSTANPSSEMERVLNQFCRKIMSNKKISKIKLKKTSARI